MHIPRSVRYSAAAICAVVAVGLGATAAGASAGPHIVSVTTGMTQVSTVDNGHGTPPGWANDSFTEATSIYGLGPAASSNCAPDTGTCYAYVALFGVSDKGSFTTIPGAGAPNQAAGCYAGNKITGSAMKGTLTGDVTYSEFFSVQKPSAASFPRKLSGVSDTGTYPALAFPDPSKVHGLSITAYDFRYNLTEPSGIKQHWEDSSGLSNNDGNSCLAGQITG